MPEPLRVLQVLGSSAGGVARHVRQVAQATSAPAPQGPGWTVRVAAPAALADVLTPPGGPVGFDAVEISDRPRRQDAEAARRLRSLAAGADVLHAHGLRAGALAVVAARTLPPARRPRVVVTLHNLPVGGRSVRAVSAVLEQVVARGADVVLGVSGDLVDRASRLGARVTERALVPAPGRPPVARDPAAVRTSLGLEPGTALVVTVARLAPQKGLDTLLGAAQSLARDGTAPVWVVAGDGPLHGPLAERIAAGALPVRLLGRRDDAADLLAAADVVVSSAVWEGQPLAIQEALAVGAAVVATDAGGTREVTADAAVLVPVGDAAALAGAVRRLLDDPDARADLRRRALARAADLPDEAAVVDQLRRVYGA
ncbi:glycosyltransferase family 4 protein [Cellulomonas aerilata]|uniref:Glycosyl transferase n=1 Tax=Cellulomonas aerilata TaxID=515326 RepID=A0A512DFQ1_9CELL|nr:glycosyltransferase family 4 protein [Cellulomonas aerilata]GEO35313.1 glycosyl transferase [Cellulomonas aerilata]